MVLPYINMNPPQVYTCSLFWTPLLPPSPYHPSGSSQCTSPKHPVSCIEPGLAIRFIYDIIQVSVPFSQIIPPSPSPTESKRLFYTSVSLLLFHSSVACVLNFMLQEIKMFSSSFGCHWSSCFDIFILSVPFVWNALPSQFLSGETIVISQDVTEYLLREFFLPWCT